MTDDILSLGDWANSNGAMIADFASVGDGWMIPGPVIDTTYNTGKFWTDYKPEVLATNDIDPSFECDMAHNYLERWPKSMHGVFGTVVYDPDYKLSGKVIDWGTNSPSYGTHIRKSVPKRKADIMAGLRTTSELVAPGGFYWLKLMDQVSLHKMHWLTRDAEDVLVGEFGWVHEARGIFRTGVRPQSSQVRARNNYSTLDIYRKPER